MMDQSKYLVLPVIRTVRAAIYLEKQNQDNKISFYSNTGINRKKNRTRLFQVAPVCCFEIISSS